MSHPNTNTTTINDIQIICAGASWEDFPEALAQLALDTNDTVYGKALLSITTGGKQTDVDDFETEYEQEDSVYFETSLIGNELHVSFDGLPDNSSVVVLKITEIAQ